MTKQSHYVHSDDVYSERLHTIAQFNYGNNKGLIGNICADVIGPLIQKKFYGGK